MYRSWPFFHSTIANIEMTLAKADFQIARQYAERLPDRDLGKRIFRLLQAEYDSACRIVRQITGEKHLLQNSPVLKRSIAVRNPYVDPMSYLQVELLARSRKARVSAKDRERLLRPGTDHQRHCRGHAQHGMTADRRHGIARTLSKLGLASRTTAADWVRDGRVAVNGRIVRDPEHAVVQARDQLSVDGSPSPPASVSIFCSTSREAW